jgi:site-specific recombinase XerD
MNVPVPVAPAERASADLVVYSASYEEALAGAKAFAGGSRAPNTIRAYQAAFAAFRAWSQASGIAEPFPASIDATAAYISHLAASGRKAATIDLHVAAIALAHRSAGHETPTTAEAVRATLKGVRRHIGTKANRKAPATAEALKKMLKRILDTLAGKRDRALLLIGFAGALRRSELVALRVSDLERTPEGVLIHIARSKTDQQGAGHTVAVPYGSKLKPVQALDAWLDAAGITEGPLFRSIDKGNRVSPYALTAQSVALIVKDRAEAAGLDPKMFSGHSLRAGFVTSALASGADLLKITHVTRHTKLETLAAYDRRAQAFKDHAGRGFL